MEFITLNLPDPPEFKMSGGTSTLAAPSADLVQALIGLPAAAGKPVTRQTAQRVAAVLSSVKTLASDIAKMPLPVYESAKVDGRVRTQVAINDPLFPLLRHVPNRYQTSFEFRFHQATQLLMNGNAYAQKITDGKGDILELIPLDAWNMAFEWDFSGGKNPQRDKKTGQIIPVMSWVYPTPHGHSPIRFYQEDLLRVSSLNLDSIGLLGSSMVALGKEAISLLIAAEEAHGRNFANGLGIGGFITFPADVEVDEDQAQNLIDRLKKDFAGSQNAGKFTVMPYGGKFEKMTWNAKDSQLLDSRKWSEETVARMFGGAPLIVKLGYGQQNSTYASSSAFLDEYFNTSLLPHTTAIEQAISRDLIDPSERATKYVKHNADIILRGSPKERAETNQILIQSAQMTPNEARAIEDRDWVEGGDILVLASNSCVFDIDEQEWFIPGQKPPTPGDDDGTDVRDNTPQDEPDAAGADEDENQTDQPKKQKDSKAKNRLTLVANSAANRIMRAAEKKELDPKFVMSVCMCSPSDAEDFCQKFKSLTAQEAHDALVALVIGDSNDSEE